MNEPRQVRFYGYLDRPYGRVRELLHRSPTELLRRATTSAAARARTVAASLRVETGGVEIAVEVHLNVSAARDDDAIAGLPPTTSVEIAWEAAHGRGLFPLMNAHLSAWPVSAAETEIEIDGVYRPPLGALGNAIDAIVGHRIAEATVHRLFEDLTEQLRLELPLEA
jgi:hypothetical protein